MKAMCEALDVQKSRTAPYHPQGNACVERFNRTLENMLSMTVKEDQSDWDLQIPFVMAAYRATPHSSAGYSPNFMMFGRESAMPTEVAYGLPQGTTTVVKWTPVVIICERTELRRLLAYISNFAYRLLSVMDCYRKISGPWWIIA